MDKKLLIIEDELLLLKVLKLQLKGPGLTVDTAHDGLEAMEKLKTYRPDLILLDVLTPKMNGVVFLEKLKQDSELKNIPVVIFSNFFQSSDVEKGLALGALEYIDKSSITIHGLVEKIHHYLS